MMESDQGDKHTPLRIHNARTITTTPTQCHDDDAKGDNALGNILKKFKMFYSYFSHLCAKTSC